MGVFPPIPNPLLLLLSPQRSPPRRREPPERGGPPSPSFPHPLTHPSSSSSSLPRRRFRRRRVRWVSALFWPGFGSSTGCFHFCCRSLRVLFFCARIVRKKLALLIWWLSLGGCMEGGCDSGYVGGGCYCFSPGVWWLRFTNGSANLFYLYDCCCRFVKYCLFFVLLLQLWL